MMIKCLKGRRTGATIMTSFIIKVIKMAMLKMEESEIAVNADALSLR